MDTTVTRRRWSAKQTIPLSVLARNQRVLDSGSRRYRKWVKEHKRNWTKGLREGSWRRVTRVASRHRTAEVTSRHERERESRAVKEDRSRWVGIPSSFVEIHASVSLHMQRNAECHNLTSCT